MREMSDLRNDLKALKWMQGPTFAGVVAIMFRLFMH